jgi:hypothetical protein
LLRKVGGALAGPEVEENDTLPFLDVVEAGGEAFFKIPFKRFGLTGKSVIEEPRTEDDDFGS